MPFEKVRPRKVSAVAAEQLTSAIKAGLFPVGSKLPSEFELAEEMGVSRPSIREALSALQAVGLIASRPGSGHYVLKIPSIDEEQDAPHLIETEAGCLEVMEVRSILEPTGGKGYIGQKGELWVEATFTGKAAHGSVPELGVNTILPAAWFCTNLSKASSEFPAVSGRGRTSLNIGKIDGGTQVNIVPAQTVVRIDSRTVSQAARDEVLGAIERLGNEAAQAGGTRFSMKVLNDKAPIVSDPQDPWVRRFLGAVYPGKEVVPEITPYSTDAVGIVPKLRIPVGVYGPGSIAQAHQPDEYLELHSLYAALEVLARFLQISQERRKVAQL